MFVRIDRLLTDGAALPAHSMGERLFDQHRIRDHPRWLCEPLRESAMRYLYVCAYRSARRRKTR